MRHFPIFLDLRGQRVVVSGAGETAVAKLRLLLKTEARIFVYGADPHDQVISWARAGKLSHTPRPVSREDALCARMIYAANDEAIEDARVAALGHDAGALVNVVDNLEASQFITPAIVDRDPVTVAIGTEGAAPVLARRIKAENEERLSADLGVLARAGNAFRPEAERLPHGAPRRAFWARYYDEVGPEVLRAEGEHALPAALAALLEEGLNTERPEGRVTFIGAGPGDPELLTLKARRILHEADVVLHDRLVPAPILELSRREAILVETGKTAFGDSWKQDDINALIVKHAREGHHVVRIKSGDAGIFGRLDEEMDALSDAEIAFDIVPGITSAVAAAAEAKVSLTQRGRNSSVRFLTGHDVAGFAEQDWRGLAEPGSVAAIYMGVRAARFIQGRLLIHGASAQTPMTVVENASRAGQKIVSAPLSDLPAALAEAGIKGPAILFLGLAPRDALQRLDEADHQFSGAL